MTAATVIALTLLPWLLIAQGPWPLIVALNVAGMWVVEGWWGK